MQLKARRVFSFVLLSAGKGMGAVTGWTIITVAGVALKADALFIFLVIVLVTAITLGVGAFRLWDEADEAAESSSDGGDGFKARAALVAHTQRHLGGLPDSIQFGIGTEPLTTLDVRNSRGRGKAVAVRFVQPCDRIVRQQDVPKWVRWGPPWRRRQLLVKGLSEASLLLEHFGTIPDGLEIEVYHENG